MKVYVTPLTEAEYSQKPNLSVQDGLNTVCWKGTLRRAKILDEDGNVKQVELEKRQCVFQVEMKDDTERLRAIRAARNLELTNRAAMHSKLVDDTRVLIPEEHLLVRVVCEATDDIKARATSGRKIDVDAIRADAAQEAQIKLLQIMYKAAPEQAKTMAKQLNLEIDFE